MAQHILRDCGIGRVFPVTRFVESGEYNVQHRSHYQVQDKQSPADALTGPMYYRVAVRRHLNDR